MNTTEEIRTTMAVQGISADTDICPSCPIYTSTDLSNLAPGTQYQESRSAVPFALVVAVFFVLLGPLVVLSVAEPCRLRCLGGGRACTQFVSLNYSAVRVRSLLPPCSFVKARPLTARCVCACAVPQQRGLDDG